MNKWTDKPVGRIALLGILSGLAVVLSLLEGLLPTLPVPGAKWGLSNLALTGQSWRFSQAETGLASDIIVSSVTMSDGTM